jgi:hypothetical protein
MTRNTTFGAMRLTSEWCDAAYRSKTSAVSSTLIP